MAHIVGCKSGLGRIDTRCPQCAADRAMGKMPDQAWSEDVCRFCGAHIGWGVQWLHLGVCDDPKCQAKAEEQ